MPQLPTTIPTHDNRSVIWTYFATNSIQILREEEAFSFGSLVADVGGVLGLFIGFNFLMVWDWIVKAVVKLWQLVFKRPMKHAL